MGDIIAILKEQLEREKASAEKQLTTGNLDNIFKLSGAIYNLKNISCQSREVKETAEITESIVSKYSNGRYDHNVDDLYDAYIAAKKAYQQVGDQGHKDKLMESVARLMVEVYDMISAMLLDSDFADEKKEIMRRIKMLVEV